jgi:hypothetical protein
MTEDFFIFNASEHVHSHGAGCGQKLRHTDKKEILIFLIYNEILNGAVAKAYRTNGLLICGEIFAHFLIYSIRKPFLIYGFASDPL